MMINLSSGDATRPWSLALTAVRIVSVCAFRDITTSVLSVQVYQGRLPRCLPSPDLQNWSWPWNCYLAQFSANYSSLHKGYARAWSTVCNDRSVSVISLHRNPDANSDLALWVPYRPCKEPRFILKPTRHPRMMNEYSYTAVNLELSKGKGGLLGVRGVNLGKDGPQIV